MTVTTVPMRRATRVSTEFILFCACIVVVAPIAWMAYTAFRYQRDIISRGLGGSLTLLNFHSLFGVGSYFGQELVNSAEIVVGTTVLCLAISCLSGYSLSKLGWSRKLTVTVLVVVGLLQLIPPMTLIPGLYVTLSQLGVLGGVTGLILLNTVFNLPFAAVLMKLYFDGLPGELREAALVDGSSEFMAFWRVQLPLVRPGIAAVGIFVAIQAWNEFLMGLTLTSGGPTSPVTVGIANLVQPYSVQFGQMAAAGLIAAGPIILLAIVANRAIVAGLTRGGVKA